MKKEILVISVLLISFLSGCATIKTPSISETDKDEGQILTSYSYGLFEKPNVKADITLSSINAQCKSWGYEDAKHITGPEKRCISKDPNGNIEPEERCVNWQVFDIYQCKLNAEQQETLNTKKQKEIQVQQEATARAEKAQQEATARAEKAQQEFMNNLSSYKVIFTCSERHPGSGQVKQFAEELMVRYIRKDSQGYAHMVDYFKCTARSEQIPKASILKRAKLYHSDGQAAYFLLEFNIMDDGEEGVWGIVAK